MQPRMLSAGLSQALQKVVYYQTPYIGNEDIRGICKQYIMDDHRGPFGIYLFDVLPQIDNVFDFVAEARQELDHWNNKSLPIQEKSEAPFPFIIDWIVAMVDPVCVILLSRELVADHSILDLLIVLPRDTTKGFKECECAINMLKLDGTQIKFTLIGIDKLVQYIEHGGIFFIRACQPSNILYYNHQEELPRLDTLNREVIKRKVTAVFDLGHKRSTSFLEGARHYLQTGSREMAVFMLHQAAEITLRNIILGVTGGIDGRSHSVRKLLQSCNRYAAELCQSLSYNIEEKTLDFLDSAYMEARYKSGFSVTKDDLETLSEWVELLCEQAEYFMKKVISNWIT